LVAFWTAWALATEAPSAEASPAPEGPPVAEEVVVYGEYRVQMARAALEQNLRAQGYRLARDKDGHAVWRHDIPYRAEVHLTDHGTFWTERQPIRIEGREMPWAERNSPLAWAGCVIWIPLCVRPGGQVISQRRFQQMEARTSRSVQPEVQVWNDRIADRAIEVKLQDLGERLELLWLVGHPLEGGPPLASIDERKAALLAYWATRTDTVWGAQIRAAVEGFLRAVVQTSETPLTEAELAAFNATAPQPLVLTPGARVP
jgi:hypothetical protein